MLRLDHNRALSQLAGKSGEDVGNIKNLIVWGNHSPTMYPDYRFCTIKDKPAPEVIDNRSWYAEEFIPKVGKRGAAIIEARGLSSAASAANAAIDHMRDWIRGNNKTDWVTMGVPSNGEYGIPEDIIFGFPCLISKPGEYQIVSNLEIDAFSQEMLDQTLAELIEERSAIQHLLK